MDRKSRTHEDRLSALPQELANEYLLFPGSQPGPDCGLKNSFPSSTSHGYRGYLCLKNAAKPPILGVFCSVRPAGIVTMPPPQTAVTSYLDFEKPLAEIERKAGELRSITSRSDGMNVEAEAQALDRKAELLRRQMYDNLSPWRKCQVARHPDRPHTSDYIKALFNEFVPLAGDRDFAEDHAMVGGLARLGDQAVVVIGHEKGKDIESRLHRNFGMAHPEGYQKAVRLMEMADRFRHPVITLVDTPGAYPGKNAEARGQSRAIAQSTATCLSLGVPIVSIIIGEGGSGGAVAIATANRLAMLEHAIYSVISPEGCASILWKDASKMREAADSLRLTAQDLHRLGVADRIIAEPLGGAHRDPDAAFAAVRSTILEMLAEFKGLAPEAITADRRHKFSQIGNKGLAA